MTGVDERIWQHCVMRAGRQHGGKTETDEGAGEGAVSKWWLAW